MIEHCRDRGLECLSEEWQVRQRSVGGRLLVSQDQARRCSEAAEDPFRLRRGLEDSLAGKAAVAHWDAVEEQEGQVVLGPSGVEVLPSAAPGEERAAAAVVVPVQLGFLQPLCH